MVQKKTAKWILDMNQLLNWVNEQLVPADPVTLRKIQLWLYRVGYN